MHGLLLAVTLILHSGDRIAIEGTVREEKGSLIFRSGNLLYSVPVSEVAGVEEGGSAPREEEKPTLRLRVSEQRLKELIEELEKNHSGTAPPPPPAAPKSESVAPPAKVEPQDEATWRVQARSHQENVRRAQEDLAMLQARAEQLENEIRSLLSLGFNPRDFTYQTSQLHRTRDRIPQAALEVTRAQRAFEQFREEARRAGVLPGWLR